jgi:hypothetical protein
MEDINELTQQLMDIENQMEELGNKAYEIKNKIGDYNSIIYTQLYATAHRLLHEYIKVNDNEYIYFKELSSNFRGQFKYELLRFSMHTHLCVDRMEKTFLDNGKDYSEELRKLMKYNVISKQEFKDTFNKFADNELEQMGID